jgi:hypothetical protein
MALAMRGKARCRLHAGRPVRVGKPLTAEQRAIAAANMTRGRIEKASRLRAMREAGIEAPKAKVNRAKALVAAGAPRPGPRQPSPPLPVGSRLRRLTSRFLERFEEIAEFSINDDIDRAKVVIQARSFLINAQIKVDDSTLRQQERVDKIPELLERLRPHSA